MSLYWLILERLGQGVQILMLPNEQLKNWKLTVIMALVGQFLGLAQMLYEQLRWGRRGAACSVDMFLILNDWENQSILLLLPCPHTHSPPLACPGAALQRRHLFHRLGEAAQGAGQGSSPGGRCAAAGGHQHGGAVTQAQAVASHALSFPQCQGTWP